MATKKWAAGVWEQGRGLVEWSKHSTRELATKAAMKYSRQNHQSTGGLLTWAGGVMDPEGEITWIDRYGNSVSAP